MLVVGVLSEGGGWAFGLEKVHGLVRARARRCGSVDPDRTGDLAEECKRCDVVRCVLAATSKYATEAGAWLAGWLVGPPCEGWPEASGGGGPGWMHSEGQRRTDAFGPRNCDNGARTQAD